MLKGLPVPCLLIFCLALAPVKRVFSQAENKDVQTAVHLLGYISRDYPQGVRNGEIINEQEYDEMVEFSSQALKLITESTALSGKGKIVINEIQKLRKLIDQKRTENEISALADGIRNEIIAITGIPTAPDVWPDRQSGKKLYAVNCASCHGKTGNGEGISAKGLDPSPTNFLDKSLMSQVSAYQAFNTVKLGVEGTSMTPFTDLSDQQVWDLAFYIKSLPYSEKHSDTNLLRKEFDDALPVIGLKGVAILSDRQLIDTFSGMMGDPETKVAALRMLSSTEDNGRNSLAIARGNLGAALANYKDGNRSLARTNALTAYLEGIEPVEARLKSINPGFVSKLERQMLSVRQAIEKDRGDAVLQEETARAMSLISEADELMKGQNLNYWLTFILAASIVLREGLEAFLVLAIVLALIRNSGVRKALPWLHGGWITALLMGFAGWFLSDYILQFGGKNREIMEGFISLLAVLILLSVGFWLHKNSYAKKWQQFIREKIGRYLQKDKMFGLAAFSFMVVFREAFEVILFLQAIGLEAKNADRSAIGMGTLAAFSAIAIMAYFFLKYSRKIPVRQLFRYSSWIIIVLAVILMGKGIHSIQESGLIPVTALSSLFSIDWLGIYPTLETILAQLTLVAFIFINYYFFSQQRRKFELKKG